MTAYHQMGHESWNLVREEDLSAFGGVVLSPVNESPAQTSERLASLGKRREELNIVLDPQYYRPRSDRGFLTEWDHHAGDAESTDFADMGWWSKTSAVLVRTAGDLKIDGICSPALIPRQFDDDYYGHLLDCCDRLLDSANGQIEVLQTAIVSLEQLAKRDFPERLSSILSRTRAPRIYLVLYDQVPPRQQREDQDALAGAMQLINLLEASGVQTLVAFSGLDTVLWKAAGASAVASGKFFNVRRFVPGRWEEEAEGGRQNPYWTEPSLMTFLREADVVMLLREGLVDTREAAKNPYSKKILSILDSASGEPWIKYGWRQYLYWFAQADAALTADFNLALAWLRDADQAWGKVSRLPKVLIERTNNGEWVRAWTNACVEARART